MKAATRDALPDSEFGLPEQRKYPMPDRAHAANAKSRASHQYNIGKIGKSARDKIYAKASKILSS